MHSRYDKIVPELGECTGVAEDIPTAPESAEARYKRVKLALQKEE